ncbi:dihydrofolate reductase family protein [Cesiribacter sp. SM1]|uniref:dihydrofolate reductase family protein n=1 Tax=Cesiribacter sp. SM1 TaxID=2861196 RepID=UPI001CD7007C|nr:dihydrofolate reductase family protein [Cesiribacter sp. SM1]
MRKLKLQMQVTVDGFNSTGANDEQQWITWDLDGIRQYIINLLDTSDTILLGRKLAVNYIPFWQDTFTKPDGPMFAFATRIVNARKVVFTKTLDNSVWDKTILAKGNLKEEVNKLKSQDGQDMIVYGGSAFVSSLIREGLIDEFHFFVNPIAIGKGVSAFEQLEKWQPLKLKNTITCNSGIFILHYERN